MATTIKLKNGSGAPLAGDLVQGEPAFDLTNKRLYTEDSGGTVIEVGTNPTSLTTGTFTSTGIDDNATSTKLTVSNSGIDVTGTVTSDGLTVDGGNTLRLNAASTNDFFTIIQGGTHAVLTADSDAAANMLFKTASAGVDTNRMQIFSGGDISFYDSSGTSQSLYWDASAESLGIGTSSPSTALHVYATSAGDLLTLDTASTPSSPNIVFKNANGEQARINSKNGGSLAIGTGSSGTERVLIDSSGNVGIGTTNPLRTLHVNGTSSAQVQLSTTSIACYQAFENTNSTATNAVQIGAVGTDEFAIHTGNTGEKVRVDSSGYVGIGTSSPSAVLDVSGDVATDTTLLNITGTAFTAGETIGLAFVKSGAELASVRGNNVDGTNGQLIFETSATERMRIDSSGNVGIGTDSPSAKLHVDAGNATAYSASSADGQAGAGATILADNRNGTGSSFSQLLLSHSTEGTVSRLVSINAGTSTELAFVNERSGTPTEAMRIDSSGNVGIGTTSPSTNLHVVSSTTGQIRITSGASNVAQLSFGDTADEDIGRIRYNNNVDSLDFFTSNTEAMRIDSSGNLLVGKDVADDSTVGARFSNAGFMSLVRDGGRPLFIRRNTSDGAMAEFSQDGTTTGTIGKEGTAFYVAGAVTGVRFGSTSMSPTDADGSGADNQKDLGSASYRWDDVYATNGTIQTSDANEKQDIEALSEAEQRVAVAAKGLLRKFRWRSSVEEKGDDARIHFGIIAQDLQAAFEAEGLDAGRYGMFIHSTWTDEETGEERSRMGVRYSELLAFIIAAI